jgi:2-polyprenyl-3-methyl-5-hydroxy-6-metoxy-1,4-benzoquinol methylase
MLDTFSIKSLPVYWRVKKDISSQNHQEIPERLDFSLSFNPSNGTLTQLVDERLKNVLSNIYRENENIGYLRDDNKLAVGYHIDLLDFIKGILKADPIKYILEIGCGGCTVLDELQKLGFDVTGIDPSPFAKDCANEKGIKIINDFFSPDLIDKEYGLVYFSDVLEHVFDPVEFLSDIKKALKKDSKIVIAVPDATIETLTGDYSMCMHQHISYFTEKSLHNTILQAGLEPLTIQKAGYGGSLYAIANVAEDGRVSKIPHEQVIAKSYFGLASKARDAFLELFNNAKKNHLRIFCYVPLRAIPYLASIDALNSNAIYFVDDTPFWEDSYIDGTSNMIKPLTSYSYNESDCFFVFSNTFAQRLRDKVIAHCGSSAPQIYLIRDIVG